MNKKFNWHKYNKEEMNHKYTYLNHPITVYSDEKLSPSQVDSYREYAQKMWGAYGLKAIYLDFDGDYVDITYDVDLPPFERLRRVTGYLTNTLDRWNDAKRAEESERVKHTYGNV